MSSNNKIPPSSQDENKHEAVEALFSLLQPPKPIPATQVAGTPLSPAPGASKSILGGILEEPTPKPLDVEALKADLELSKIALGVLDSPLKLATLKSTTSSGSLNPKALKRNMSLDAYEDLLKEVATKYPSLPNKDKEYLLTFLDDKAVDLARKNFYMFVKYIADEILPEDFIDGKHIRLICKELQKIEHCTYTGKPERLAISMPPGGMKSISVNLFIAWCLGRHPSWRILHLGHGTQFVEDNSGRPIRDLMGSEKFKKIFPGISIKVDSRAAGRWSTNKKGLYYAAGVGARIAGRRANLAICDDAMSEQTAYSIVERRKINAWYGPGLRSRLLPNGSEIQIGTRWHKEDLIGYLMEKDAKSKRPWKVIKIPAILKEESAKLLGMPIGESFWPEFQPLEFLQERQADGTLTPGQWSALYMQEPIPEEGSIFKEEDFKYWTSKTPPPVDLLILSLDTAYSIKTTADYSAYSLWGVFQERRVDPKGREHWVPNLILIECDRKRWDYPNLLAQVIQMKDYYQPDIILIENKASGQSLIPELKLMGYPVMDFNPDAWGDKIARANACTPYTRNGRIWLPDSHEFTSLFLQDICEFPLGSSDDLVDTFTQTILHLRNSMNMSTQEHISEEPEDALDYHRSRRMSYWNAASR